MQPSARRGFGVLGPVTAWCDGRSIALGTPRQRAVLAALLITPGRVVTVDQLVDALWDDAPPANVLSSLQSYVSNLRRVLEAGNPPGDRDRILRRRPPGYMLAIEPDHVDACLFEDAVRAGRYLADEQRFEDALDRLDKGLALWRGAPYEDFDDYQFADQEVARLEELRLFALETRFEIQLILGFDPTVIAADLRTLWIQSPTRERLGWLLMVALYRGGRTSEALRVFESTRKALQDEFGIDPDARLQQLFISILRQDIEPVESLTLQYFQNGRR